METKPNINKLQRRWKQWSIAIVIMAGNIVGCSGGDDVVPTKNAPAAQGAGGVPMLSQEQLEKLPADRKQQIMKDQAAMEAAASANITRKQSGQMPNVK